MKQFLIIILLIFILFSSCNQKAKYEGRWVLVKVEYNQKDILDFIMFRNFTISYGKYGGTPTVHYKQFDETGMVDNEKFTFFSRDEKDYIAIKGSKFFTDTFEVRCLNEPCCHIALKNDQKYIELVFNGEFTFSSKRRECPYLKDVDLNKYR